MGLAGNLRVGCKSKSRFLPQSPDGDSSLPEGAFRTFPFPSSQLPRAHNPKAAVSRDAKKGVKRDESLFRGFLRGSAP